MRRSLHGIRRGFRRRLFPAVGDVGETLALKFLLGKGYDVVARNFHIGSGELDLIAYDGETLVFVEVKTRSRRDAYAPQAAVGARKQAQLACLARAFCHRYGLDGSPVRFDVVAVTMSGPARPRIEHFVGAF